MLSGLTLCFLIMRRSRPRLPQLVAAGFAVALALGGCGDSDDTGVLAVSQVFQPPYPYGIEGSTTQLVVREGDHVVVDVAPDWAGVDEVEMLRRSVPAGKYEISALQHDCQVGGCSAEANVDAQVVISCSERVDIHGGETTPMLVRVNPDYGGSCTIEPNE